MFSGLGQIFGNKIERRDKTALIGKSIVLVSFNHIENDEVLFSDGLLFEEKLEMINEFPVLRLVGKKLISLVNNFKIRNFNFKDVIYKKGEEAKSIFFIIEGNVSF